MTPKEQQGMWFGLLGVMTFAVTLPVTRLAVGTPEDPHLSGVFVAMGRAAVAGILTPRSWTLFCSTKKISGPLPNSFRTTEGGSSGPRPAQPGLAQ